VAARARIECDGNDMDGAGRVRDREQAGTRSAGAVKTVTWQNSAPSPTTEREAERIACEGMPAPGRAGPQRTITGAARPEQ
jgi:hypothetical protein